MPRISKFLFVLLTIPLLPIALVFLFFTIIVNKVFDKKQVQDEDDHLNDDYFSACIKD